MEERELEEQLDIVNEEDTLVLSEDSGLNIMEAEEVGEMASQEETLTVVPQAPARKIVHGEALDDGPPPPDLSRVGDRMDDEERWYILHTFNGYEMVAEDNLKKVVEKYNLHNRIKEIFIPTEDVVMEKRGKKVVVPQRIMPSYVFVKMIYGDDLWHTITRTRGITGFVGPKGRPLPLSPREVAEMNLDGKVAVASGTVRTDEAHIEVGAIVKVVDGPLAGQTASVTDVNKDAQTLTVSVTMFGKPTLIDLTFAQVKLV